MTPGQLSRYPITIKFEGPASSRTSTEASAAIERCRAENAVIERENATKETHNREQEQQPLAERHLLVIEGIKLCV
jgi:hypothetical protein